jgi:hypothetical protein
MLMASFEATRLLAFTILPTPGRTRATVHTGARVQDNLTSVEAAWEGRYRGGAGPGIAALVETRSPTASARTATALRAAVRGAKGLPDSLADASPAQLRRAYQPARKLTRLLELEVAAQLGVTIDLSDADGDS